MNDGEVNGWADELLDGCTDGCVDRVIIWRWRGGRSTGWTVIRRVDECTDGQKRRWPGGRLIGALLSGPPAPSAFRWRSDHSSVIGVMELKINSPTTRLLSPPLHRHSTSPLPHFTNTGTLEHFPHVLVLHSRAFQRHYTFPAMGTSPSTVQAEAYCVKMVPWIPGNGSRMWVPPFGFG